MRDVAALSALLLICGCGQQSMSDDGYKQVRQKITYGAGEERARRWDALTAALDDCHKSGFTDAQPSQASHARCVESDSSGCRRYTATWVWDCIGMGYQSN